MTSTLMMSSCTLDILDIAILFYSLMMLGKKPYLQHFDHTGLESVRVIPSWIFHGPPNRKSPPLPSPLTYSCNSGKLENRTAMNRRDATNTTKRVIKFRLEDWRGTRVCRVVVLSVSTVALIVCLCSPPRSQ